MVTVYGANGSTYWKVRLDYEVTETETTVSIRAVMYLYYSKQCALTISDFTKYVEIGGTRYNSSKTGTNVNHVAGYSLQLLDKTVTYNKTDVAQIKTVKAYLKRTNSSTSSTNGTSQVSVDVIIPPLKSKAKVKINNTWVDCEPRVKVNGQWRNVVSVYAKVNGVWKET